MKKFYDKVGVSESGCWIWLGCINDRYGYFTVNEVIEIRRLCSEGKLLQYEIAEKFNVDPKTITNIKLRRQWSHI